MLSCIGAVGGLLTVKKYQNLCEKVGEEASATVRVAGREVRSTMEKGEKIANRLLNVCERNVDTCLEKMRKNASEVIELGGIEARYTLENSLLDARLKTGQVITQTGTEVCKASFLLNQDIQQTVDSTADQINLLMQNGEARIKNILQEGDQHGESLIKSIDQVIVQNIAEVKKHLLDLANECNRLLCGIILNIGAEGRLLIRDTGKEISICADHALSKAFEGQQMIVECFGEEARFSIAAFGQEMRSTLYEIPYLANVTAEQIGKGIISGLKEGLLGESLLGNLKKEMGRIFQSSNKISIDFILKFLIEQDQKELTPVSKVQLYINLIHTCNSLNRFPNEEMKKHAFILIVQTALKDPILSRSARSWIGWMQPTNYPQQVIDAIPGENLRKSLKSKDIYIYYLNAK